MAQPVVPRELGAAEIIFDVHFSPDVKDGAGMLAKLEQLAKLGKG